MWESPAALWRRLKLGREEYLQRLVTTLIVDGDPPPWNTPRSPGEAGRRFLQLLDEAAHGPPSGGRASVSPDGFVDEYLLPKLEEDSANGWPDWAVLWPERVWVIELKTEAGSHRADQLPYYLRLAAAAHPGRSLDLTYVTGPLVKPAPALIEGQRYSHLAWAQVASLISEAWDHDSRPEVAAYVEMVTRIVGNLGELKPSEQRRIVLGLPTGEPTGPQAQEVGAAERTDGPLGLDSSLQSPVLLELARATATDGHQRAAGAHNPDELEALRDRAMDAIGSTAPDDLTRLVLPWLWKAGRTDGKALTPEGREFGCELRFSRYQAEQIATPGPSESRSDPSTWVESKTSESAVRRTMETL